MSGPASASSGYGGGEIAATAGTARPSAQGQVTISTAAAMFTARRKSPVIHIQPAKLHKAIR